MALLKRPQSSIAGLVGDLSNITGNIGDLTALSTTEKASLVAAINEIQTVVGNLESGNGTQYVVADITERDGLTGLTVADTVFVQDDGDGKWALYKPGAVDGSGVGSDWVKLNDEDSLTNALSASSIKTAYESNTDTNAYTDSEKAKLGLISITEELDLDQLAADVAASTSVTPVTETLTVTSGQITLSNAPRNGVAGIMNFGMVRRTVDGSSEDASVAATGTPELFDVETDTAGAWDGDSVTVQYLY